jgi:hypothetical protein
MICQKCGIEFKNTCVNCGRENHNGKTRCDGCLHIVDLNIQQDKKFKIEGGPIPDKWSLIMYESLHPDILCPDCIKVRNRDIEYNNMLFWIKFKRDNPI